VTAIGFVTLVGAGPGGAELLTLAGRRALEEADCVVHDRLVSTRLLDFAPPSAERIYVGKTAGGSPHCASQESINEILVDRATKGLKVVRLKGGDPLLFGRGGEELEALAAAGIPFAVIPGVTAALAASAFAGVPLTHRSEASAVAFVTGHEDPAKSNSLDPKSLAEFPGTIAVYMPLKRSSAFAAALIAHGKPADTPAVFVEWASTNRQRSVETTLGALADADENSPIAKLHSPVLAIIGEVCRRRERLQWFESRPLFRTRVLVLRPPHQAMELIDKFERLGTEVLSTPAFEILPPQSWAAVDAAIERLAEFAWIVFTSRNGVEFFIRRLVESGRDLRLLGSCKLAAIGPGTAAALAAFHLHADLVPDEFRAEALADALAPSAAGKNILLVRADRGREELERRLETVATIEKIVAYRQVDVDSPSDEVREAINANGIDWVVFTSSNMAAAFWKWKTLFDESAWNRLKFATISPVTSDAVRRLGGKVSAEASVYTMDGVVDAVRAAITSSSV
jgi:uroporphyrinogen III methyltransferase/synthase